MKKTKIDWCDSTVNAVIGCPRLCGAEFDTDGNMIKKPWCYAWNMNERFHWVDDFSKPQLKSEQLRHLRMTRPRSIFMNSISDYEFWPQCVVEKVGAAMDANSQHKYLFLTKGNQAFMAQQNFGINENVFNGKTITCQRDTELWENAHAFDFLSIEPLLGPIIFFPPKLDNIGQVIIGAETGTRSDKIVPKKEWVDEIVEQCDKRVISVFMKENLRSVMGDAFRQDPLLWEMKGENNADIQK